MLSLIKLEVEKYSLRLALIIILFTNALLLGIMYLVLRDVPVDYELIFSVTDSLILVVACVLSSALFNWYVVEAIQTGEFRAMDHYGINRSSALYAKILLVIGVASLFSVLTFLVVFLGTVYMHGGHQAYVKGWHYLGDIKHFYHVLGICVSYVMIGLFPGYIAIRMASKVVMITASWLLALALSSVGENVLGSWYNQEIAIMAFVSGCSIILMRAYIDSHKL